MNRMSRTLGGTVLACILTVTGLPVTESALGAPPPGKGPAISWSAAIDVTVAAGSGTSIAAAFTSSKSLSGVVIAGAGVPVPFVFPSPTNLSSVAAATPVAINVVIAVPIGTAPGNYRHAVFVTAAQRFLPNALPVMIRVVAATNNVDAISAGGGHTCALMSAGGVKCWGYQQLQVAPGTTTSTASPVSVDTSSISGGLVAIEASEFTDTCALTTNGTVACWPDIHNDLVPYLVPLIGTPPTPVSPFEPANVVAIAKGGATAAGFISGMCVLSDVGAVICSPFPQLPTISSGAIAITKGFDHACAIVTGGAVKCWGNNAAGQLGDGSTTTSTIPVDVVGLSSGVLAISAGAAHTCALTNAGGVKCWGDNSFGALGAVGGPIVSTPVDVSGLTNGVSAISAGANHSCARTSVGGATCWGYNASGQLGDGTFDNRSAPVSVSGLASGVVAVSAGSAHTCAIVTGGGVKCWGHNNQGELGTGSFTPEPGIATPVDVVF